MSPKSNDYLGEVIATAYLLFLGLLFSYIVPAVLPKGISSLGLFQIGFAVSFSAFAIVRLTRFDITGLAVGVLGLAIENAGLRATATMHFDQWIMLLVFAQVLLVGLVMVITHIRDGIFERSPVL